MPLSTKVGSFSKRNSSLGVGTQAITGVGFQPKAIIFWSSGSDQVATMASGTWYAHQYELTGFTAGSTNSYAVGTFSQDAANDSNSARRTALKALTMPTISGTGTLWEADLSSFDADGFTLNWTTNDGGAGQEINYLALGGTDITGAKVVEWDSPTANGAQSVTGVGFKPDLVFFAGALGAALLPFSGVASYSTFGVMNKSGQQFANSTESQDASNLANTRRWQQTDACIAITASGGASFEQAHYQSMDADGFSLFWSLANGTAYSYIALCLQGVSSKIGAFNKTTATAPAAQAIERVGFAPKAVLTSTIMYTATHTSQVNSMRSVGAADGVSQRVSAYKDDHNIDPMAVDSIWMNDRVSVAQAGGGYTPAVQASASLSSLDADGFTLSWSPNTTSAIEVCYLALGDAGVLTRPTAQPKSDIVYGTGYPNQRRLDRTSNGVLWLHTIRSTNSEAFFSYSTDNGKTWTDTKTFLVDASGNSTNSASHPPNASFYIDEDDYAHWVYKHNSNGNVYYRRGTPNADRTAWTWSTAQTFYSGADVNYPDVVAFRTPGASTWDVVVVSSLSSSAAVLTRVMYKRWRVSADGTTFTANLDGLSESGTAGILYQDTSRAVHTFPSIDFNHTGNGKTIKGSVPHLYAAWSAGASGLGRGIRFRKATYALGSWSWGTERNVDTGVYIANADFHGLQCVFDGTRVMIGGYLHRGSDSLYGLMLWERDPADSADANTATHVNFVQGTFYQPSMAYDALGNIHWVASGGVHLAYQKWTRSGASLGTRVYWEPTQADFTHPSMKRGYSGQRIEWAWTAGNNNQTTSLYYQVKNDAIVLNQNPSAPTLSSPANAATVSLSGTPQFSFVFNDPDTADTMSAWYFRRKVSGAASYEYWNVTTGAWQSTEVKNTGTANNGATYSYTFPSGAWTNGSTYNWSVATEDQNGAKGVYASDFTVTGGTAPTVTVTGPASSITDSTRPTVTWSYSDTESDPQTKYQVVVESGSYGTTPGSGTSVWDTGVVTDSAGTVRSRTVGVDLENGTTYRFFVQSTQTGGQVSNWGYVTGTVTLDPPAAPTITATAEASQARVKLAVQGRDNLLTANQASAETDTTGWTVTNGTLTRDTTVAKHGTASFKLTDNTTNAAADNLSINTGTGSNAPTITVGQSYTILASFRPSVARSVRIDWAWVDSAGTRIGSYQAGTEVAAATGTWTAVTQATGAAPANAARLHVFLVVLAVADGEVHNIDAISVTPGSSTTWTRGGLSTLTVFDLEYSDDGGVTWKALRNGSSVAKDSAANQQATVYDYEAPPSQARLYRAKARAEV